MKLNQLPAFLIGRVSPDSYERWLFRKAQAHVKRDRKRGRQCAGSEYRSAIHRAVVQSGGKDAYTGEQLDWSLISQYDNDASKSGKHAYKAGFALLPTVDHFESALHDSGFRICAWRTNDAKHDLNLEDFLTLCHRVVAYGLKELGDSEAPT